MQHFRLGSVLDLGRERSEAAAEEPMRLVGFPAGLAFILQHTNAKL